MFMKEIGCPCRKCCHAQPVLTDVFHHTEGKLPSNIVEGGPVVVILVLAEIWKENKEMNSFSKKMNILSCERKVSKVTGRQKAYGCCEIHRQGVSSAYSAAGPR